MEIPGRPSLDLSDAEKIAALMRAGMTRVEIAAAIGCSLSTVDRRARTDRPDLRSDKQSRELDYLYRSQDNPQFTRNVERLFEEFVGAAEKAHADKAEDLKKFIRTYGDLLDGRLDDRVDPGGLYFVLGQLLLKAADRKNIANGVCMPRSRTRDALLDDAIRAASNALSAIELHREGYEDPNGLMRRCVTLLLSAIQTRRLEVRGRTSEGKLEVCFEKTMGNPQLLKELAEFHLRRSIAIDLDEIQRFTSAHLACTFASIAADDTWSPAVCQEAAVIVIHEKPEMRDFDHLEWSANALHPKDDPDLAYFRAKVASGHIKLG